MSPPVVVSDHAVIRYLERVVGLDIDGARRAMRDGGEISLMRHIRHVMGVDPEPIRAHIAALVAPGVARGACAVVVDGWRYVLRPVSHTVITVTSPLTKYPRRARAPRYREAAE